MHKEENGKRTLSICRRICMLSINKLNFNWLPRNSFIVLHLLKPVFKENMRVKWKSFSCVQLLVTPWTIQSVEFSRPEYWSGLPFPSPRHESEKWKGNCSVVSDSSRLHGLQPTRLLRLWDFPGKSTGVGCHCLRQRQLFVTLWTMACQASSESSGVCSSSCPLSQWCYATLSLWCI